MKEVRLPNGVAYKRTPKSFRYKLIDLLFTKFKRTKTEQTKSTKTTNTTTDHSVPLETRVSCDSITLKINPELLNQEQNKELIIQKRVYLLQQNLTHLLLYGHPLPFYDILCKQYENEYQLQCK